ncbi:MAG: two-component sensor histidine kinase [Actinobacteria bacterium]|nr:two-component sensor histidine kinase [Actinomycetota bacterium]
MTLPSSASEQSIPSDLAQPQLTEEDSELRLPRPPGVFRRWLAAHPRLVDWTIVGCYLFGCLLMMVIDGFSGYAAESFGDIPADTAEQMTSQSSYLGTPVLLLALLAIAIVATALVFRRRFPFIGLIVITLLLWIDFGALGFANSVALIFLLYAVPVYRSQRAGWFAYGSTLLSHVLYLFLAYAMQRAVNAGDGIRLSQGAGTGGNIFLAQGPQNLSETIGMSIMTALWLLAVLMVGINVGNRKRYLAALIDRARQLAREREQRAELAAAAERARIAREMHDIVAHSLSVVVTLSEAASVAIEAQPAAAKQAMDRAAETGRSALTEMRRLLGVLNEDRGEGTERTAPLAPQPGVAQLPQLIAGFVDAGLAVTVVEQGVPVGDAAQQLAVYRIVQESLTNALRHAGHGATATVSVTHSAGETRIEVVDSGAVGTDPKLSATGEPKSIPGSGRGLAGATQRAAVFGGTLDAGPYGRGWRLTAVVPICREPAAQQREGAT